MTRWTFDRQRGYIMDAGRDIAFDGVIECEELVAAANSSASLRDALEKAVELGFQYGSTDGAHHKTWVIDQMLRLLLGDKYEAEVDDEWDIGIAP